jgi:hypothetical protein
LEFHARDQDARGWVVTLNREDEIKFRRYAHKRDAEAILEVFKEVGWLEPGKDREKDAVTHAFFKAGRSWIAELRGRAESLALAMAGAFCYLNEDLSLCAVTAVVTSTIARRLQCASRTTAEAIADAAEEGTLVAGLGVFEQGFYNRLGFGSGPYEHWIDFDPATLKVDAPSRPPHRLTASDWKAVHSSRLARKKGHGSCNVFSSELTQIEMADTPKGFGFGYYDGKELTHHVWLSNQGGEHGPVVMYWSAFQTYQQFLELLSLVKSIGDQFHLVKMREPPGIQLQDLIEQPFKYQRMTRQARFECRARALAYWQLRILDLKGCIEKTHLQGAPVRFNLELVDPINEHLCERKGWRGVQGTYMVNFGGQSRIEASHHDRLPTLRAEVGAFTRMWMGAQSASTLAVTDVLEGPAELIESLDRIFQIPVPHTDWDF